METEKGLYFKKTVNIYSNIVMAEGIAMSLDKGKGSWTPRGSKLWERVV